MDEDRKAFDKWFENIGWMEGVGSNEDQWKAWQAALIYFESKLVNQHNQTIRDSHD